VLTKRSGASLASLSNRQVRLAAHPVGFPELHDFELVEVPLPDVPAGPPLCTTTTTTTSSPRRPHYL
jgi:hypothetical protein